MRNKSKKIKFQKPVLLINQSIGPLFQDVINACERKAKTKVFKGIKYSNIDNCSRFFTWSIFTFQVGIHIIFNQKRYSEILFVSNPPFTTFLSLFTKTSFSFILYDLYPEVLEQIYLPKLIKKIIKKLWRIANSRAFKRCKKIYTLSDNMAENIQKYFLNKYEWNKKVKVIPPWTNTKNIYHIPKSKNNFRREINKDDCFLVSYSGNLGLTHPLEILVEASNFITAKARILIIGGGPKLNYLKNLANSKRIDSKSLRFIESLPFSLLAESSSAADLAIVTLDEKSSNASLPSKTFTSLATATPILVIANKHSALAKLIRKHKCGYVIEPSLDAHIKVAKLINHLAENKFKLKKLSKNALEASTLYTHNNASLLVSDWLKE